MRKVRIGVLVSGGGTNLQSLLDGIAGGGINGEVVVAISDRPEAYALERARHHGIKAVYIGRENCGRGLREELDAMKVELVVLAGFLTILDRDFVRTYEGRIMNIHPSLIPSFCGKGFYGERVHKAAVEYGVKVSGATVHFVDEGTDSGPIILQEAVAVDGADTAESLAAKVLKLEHKLLPAAVGLYCGGKLKIEGRKVKILE